MIIDYWYGHSKRDVASIDIFFYPNDGEYRGNLFDKNNKYIGDFTAKSSQEIERTFPKLVNFGD